jgi:hypothetical protein
MNPRIHELIDYLDRERADLDVAIAAMPAERHGVRPAPDAWCAAEVVNHLALTDRRITGLLTKLTGDAKAGGARPDADASPILPGMDVGRILDRTSKIRNPRGDPAADCNLPDGLAALDAARADLKALLLQPDLPDLGRVSAPHPVFGLLNGYEWVVFMAAHTRRHADQIREIASRLPA